MGRGEGGGHTRTVGAGGGTSAGRARVTPPAATAATSAATSHLSPQTAAAAEANAALLGLTSAQFVPPLRCRTAVCSRRSQAPVATATAAL